MNKNKEYWLDKFKLLSDARNLGLIAFGIVALLVTWSGVKVVQTNYELDKKIAVARQKNDIARLENDNLKLKNKYYESSQYLELAARRQFGKAAPGEKLYIIPEQVALAKTKDRPVEQGQAEPIARTQTKWQKNYQAWKNFLLR